MIEISLGNLRLEVLDELIALFVDKPAKYNMTVQGASSNKK